MCRWSLQALFSACFSMCPQVIPTTHQVHTIVILLGWFVEAGLSPSIKVTQQAGTEESWESGPRQPHTPAWVLCAASWMKGS